MRTPGYHEQTESVDELVSANMELVKRIAWHIYGRVVAAVEIEDLVQIGYTGLVMAAQNYTIKEGASFASYASIRIRGLGGQRFSVSGLRFWLRPGWYRPPSRANKAARST